jgi:hypothetical protein
MVKSPATRLAAFSGYAMLSRRGQWKFGKIVINIRTKKRGLEAALFFLADA